MGADGAGQTLLPSVSPRLNGLGFLTRCHARRALRRQEGADQHQLGVCGEAPAVDFCDGRYPHDNLLVINFRRRARLAHQPATQNLRRFATISSAKAASFTLLRASA
jgi:hypothetical protein